MGCLKLSYYNNERVGLTVVRAGVGVNEKIARPDVTAAALFFRSGQQHTTVLNFLLLFGSSQKVGIVDEGRILHDNGDFTYEYHLRDHLGSVRVAFTPSLGGGQGEAAQEIAYYPFGAPIAALSWSNQLSNPNRYKHTGMETVEDFGLGYVDNSMRWRGSAYAGSRFLSRDPLAAKYPHLSPYIYGGNNPMNVVDFRGDSITIVHRKGFLGLGGKETLTYENGNLYNADGSAYSGKVKGYLKSVVNALGNLNATTEGASLVSELQNSTNMFTIKSGNNAFVPNSTVRAGANLAEVQAVTGNMAGSTGSGGTIYWNANSTSGGLDLTGSTSRPAYIGLGHEMGHASDANQGLLHFSSDYTNAATGVTYYSAHNGLLKSEWRAVYRENLIRMQAGISMRTHYGINMTTGIPVGMGPSLITPLIIPFAVSLPLPYLPLNYR